MIKKVIISVIIIVAVAATAVFVYRYQIFQYSAEAVIRKVLPDYVRVDKINFDLRNRRVILTGFKILNPVGYSARYLLEIEDIRCRYKMKGANILDGIEILSPELAHLTLNIERLRDSRLNLTDMQKRLERPQQKTVQTKPAEADSRAAPSRIVGDKTLPDILKLPERFSLKDGKVIFIDRLPSAKPYILTLENVDANLGLRLNSSYTALLNLASTGQGNVSGNRDEVVKWVISFDPTTPNLTMSNRFEVYNVDILPFEPYYDRHSPFVFKEGRFSGLLIFDFDNGSIGSSNEIHLSNYRFYIKQGYENASFWDTTVPDLVKYFTSPYGEIVFDFKIKGVMSNPRFYLGPISKQAITAMAIDKISSAIQRVSGQGQASGAQKTDIEKAKDYIDMLKGLINKK